MINVVKKNDKEIFKCGKYLRAVRRKDSNESILSGIQSLINEEGAKRLRHVVELQLKFRQKDIANTLQYTNQPLGTSATDTFQEVLLLFQGRDHRLWGNAEVDSNNIFTAVT